MSRLRTFLYLFVVILFLFGGARLYYRLTDDFRISNIKYEMPYDASWDMPRPDVKELAALSNITQQKFHYIGKGAQCYAFVSDDGQYVLKFFKFKHLKPNPLVHLIPSIYPFKSFKENNIERKRRKLYGVFDGYALAYRENKQDSELIYMHLMPTNYLEQSVTVKDKLGIERTINLDEVVFLIQRKGETLRTRMQNQLNNDAVADAKNSIAQILAMYATEYKKGLYDRDHGVMHNTGFVEDRPFHLDVGKFTKDSHMQTVDGFAPDMQHVIWKIDVWIKHNYPDYYADFTAYLSEVFHDYTGLKVNFSDIDPAKYKKRKH